MTAAPADDWQPAPCGLMVAGADGIIVRANLTVCRWLGYDPAELIGLKRFSELMPMGARVFLQTHWTPLLQIQGSVSEVQLDLFDRDRRRIPMMLSAIRRQRDGVVHDEIALLIATDRKSYERELRAERARAEAATADLAQAQAQLHAANAALSLQHRHKDEFLATLAHELRNPLAPMQNIVETLRLRQAGDGGRAAEILARQVAQITRLVDDLLNVSRIGQGKVSLALEPADIVPTLHHAAEEALSTTTAAGQQLTVDLPATPLWVLVDTARLTQIVANLLTNASKYSPAGARIALSARMRDDRVLIEVADNGIGIAPDQLLLVFEKFSQLTPGLERAQGGLGIGLSLVKGLVELHGGTVVAHSDGAGSGSRFTVSLPATAAPAAPAPVEDDHPDNLAGHGGLPVGVLIVDDNVDAADTLAMALDFLGYRTTTAHTAQAALLAMEQVRPAAAILDIGLPDMSGYALARAMRATTWGTATALIAVTGWGQDASKQAASAAGFDLHFTKPVDFHQVDRGLRQVLQRRTTAAIT
jgi:signal transduction histidine kinase/CheY-like chemotaxis protein